VTDARFPERWLSDKRIQRLSDAHFRSYVTSLTWSVSNRTDGNIEPEDLALIPQFSANAVMAFVKARLWLPQDHGWLIADFAATQTTAAELRAAEASREKERLKKAEQRAKKAKESTVPGDVPGDVPRDITGKASDRQEPGAGGDVMPLKRAVGGFNE